MPLTWRVPDLSRGWGLGRCIEGAFKAPPKNPSLALPPTSVFSGGFRGSETGQLSKDGKHAKVFVKNSVCDLKVQTNLQDRAASHKRLSRE